MCYAFSKQLVARGHEVTVYTTDTLNIKKRIKKGEDIIDGIKIKRFRNVSNALTYRQHLYFSPGMFLAMQKDLKSFDIIHMHEYRNFQNALIHYYAVKFRLPYILQAHGTLPRKMGKRKCKKIYDTLWGNRLLRDASMVLSLTQTETEQYKEKGVKEDRIKLLPNGIDPSEFENLPPRCSFKKKYGLNSDQKLILYLGRIHESKGLDLLVKAFTGLTRELDEVQLVIVGPDDGYLSALKNLITDLKIGNKVIFTGPLYEKNKLEAYVDADVFITPSFNGFPMTFLEACVCGIPIITTEKGDRLDWIHNQVGYVVAYEENQLKQAMIKILNNADLAKQLKEGGQKLVSEKFNWQKLTKQLEHIYLEAKAIQ